MNKYCQHLIEATEPLRNQLVSHTLYSSLRSPERLKCFMEHHVYAVWDFMSLLKSLQRNLTCIDVPWVPKGDASTRSLINEIVLGEESDIDQNGITISHFELYLKAMEESGCNTTSIKNFVSRIERGESVGDALIASNAPKSSAEFVQQTFATIHSHKIHCIAAVFTFGREDLIPEMFLPIIQELQQAYPHSYDTLHYYIQRHIDVDGGHHSQLALEMLNILCGNNEEYWKEAQHYVEAALTSRIALWDAITKN